MPTPVAYSPFETSWFHYVSLLVLVAVIVYLIVKFKKATDKQFKRTILIAGIVMVVCEIYKQWIFTYQAGYYQWYAFPFQFCSTPMYLFLVLGLSRNKTLDSYIVAFLATYGTFAGLAVMAYPSSVFISLVGINIQTMVHHGLIGAIGVALLVRNKMDMKMFVRGVITFVTLSAIAYGMNTIFNLSGMEGTFNMFFINHRFGTEIPVLSLIEPVVPHVVFLIVYVFGFTFVASLVHFSANGIRKLATLKTKKQQLAYQN
ncbi:YwaF family protein [Acholeplasma equirhinis]|uniref:TMEM164 family acyltransferase n=1 Tax=Acholeplasma equirhinis TaxID=555393 RepID=UPI00197AF1C8|nr:YwaF family protein [Acholeplasma equirhinis]MBN3490075.1 YwaF family protein [Acholeplasma equirhinis]